MRLNIEGIAKLAGVSRSTVSRVISGKGYASPETRRRVLAVIEQMQYKPNAVARAMASQRTNSIGVIVFRKQQPIVSHPLYGKLVDAILLAAESLGYSVFLKTDQEMSLNSTDFMLEKRVEGLILISRLHKNVIDYVKKFDVPYLMVNGSTDDPDVIHLVSDDVSGGRQAADHLYGLGHRNIWILAGPQEHRSHKLRLEGFLAWFEERGCGQGLTVVHSPDSTFEQGRRMLAEHWEGFMLQRCTAVFATNDMLALGAIRELSERAVSVPGQVAVMGFDGTDYAAVSTPPLTTVQVDTQRMGADAVATLDCLVRRDGEPTRLKEYECQLIVRQSTLREE
jgi:DNA-binding LacI/PurR family transcriptional regulator